jgi:hypothetical protein
MQVFCLKTGRIVRQAPVLLARLSPGGATHPIESFSVLSNLFAMGHPQLCDTRLSRKRLAAERYLASLAAV